MRIEILSLFIILGGVVKILVDENIPYAHELFGRTGEVITVPGRTISKKNLDNIDALMVRSVTQVNEALLNGKEIMFVGTATAGTDHIDKNFLARQGIGFSAAPGCNAIAVVEYVFSALLMLAERDGFSLTDRTVGIVGVGHVGGLLQNRLKVLGVKTMLCDPPRADRGDEGIFLPLKTLVEQADVLTFHAPLFTRGRYKTLNMVDLSLLRELKKNAILINTCRGKIVNNEALFRILHQRDDLSVILDVWDQEPDLNVDLLKRVDIGTAHIAGYTLEGKARGAIQIFEAWSRFIGQEQNVSLETLLPESEFDHIKMHGHVDQATLKNFANLVHDLRFDNAALRKSIDPQGEFDFIRKNYQKRREWSSLHIQCDDATTAALLQKLGFNSVYKPITQSVGTSITYHQGLMN